MSRAPVSGRFAPSPTGDFHAGNARTALLAWLHARSADGRFILRVEDLDAGRVRPEFYDSQLRDLRWLGLDWDEGPDIGGPFAPYLQSQRTDLYDDALARLAEQGMLYECVCTRREIAEAAAAPHADDEEGPRYPGTCSGLDPEEIRRRSRHGTALRFRTPDRDVSFTDLLHGKVSFRPNEEVGDFVVRRKDGVAAYQLAVVVDDAAMKITHVVRGADLLPSTARQILLYEALGLPAPHWIHVPLLLGPDGERLAKRHDAPTIRELRESGASAEAVVGWLAASAGLVPQRTRITTSQLVDSFSTSRLDPRPSILPPFSP